MMNRMVSVVVLALVSVPSSALAQARPSAPPSVIEAPPAASTETGMRQELRHKRFVVLPRPPMETIVEDSERVREALTAPERRDELIRESRERPLSRPELDSSITSGIQARRVLRALQR